MDGGGTAIVSGLTVGTSGQDINLNSTSITNGQTVTISTGHHHRAGAAKYAARSAGRCATCFGLPPGMVFGSKTQINWRTVTRLHADVPARCSTPSASSFPM
jgi:hypothetical protein